MAACLWIFPLPIFFFPKAGEGKVALLQINRMQVNSPGCLLVFCFFLLLVACLGYLFYRRRKRLLRQAASREGHNHPAIPSPVYETLQTPEPAKGRKGKAPQQKLPPQPVAPPGQDELPDAYSFYTQLDRLEED